MMVHLGHEFFSHEVRVGKRVMRQVRDDVFWNVNEVTSQAVQHVLEEIRMAAGWKLHTDHDWKPRR
jgi:hypothetical protein